MAEYLYKVKPGDTILSVCLTHDLSWEEFMVMNPDFNILGHRYAGDLVVGERLVVGNSKNVFDKLRLQTKRNQK